MGSRISIVLNIENNKVKIDKVIGRFTQVLVVQTCIKIIELQCKRYRLTIKKNSVGVPWSKTRDTAAPHYLWSGQDQDKPNNTKCQYRFGKKRSHWINNWIIENLEFHLKLTTNANFFKERGTSLSCLEQYCFVDQPMGPQYGCLYNNFYAYYRSTKQKIDGNSKQQIRLSQILS